MAFPTFRFDKDHHVLQIPRTDLVPLSTTLRAGSGKDVPTISKLVTATITSVRKIHLKRKYS